jgi:hypothetical protein
LTQPGWDSIGLRFIVNSIHQMPDKLGGLRLRARLAAGSIIVSQMPRDPLVVIDEVPT